MERKTDSHMKPPIDEATRVYLEYLVSQYSSSAESETNDGDEDDETEYYREMDEQVENGRNR